MTNHVPTYLFSLYILILAMCSYLLIECLFSMSTGTMSSFPRTNFLKTDAMFLEFTDDLDNLVGGSSLMGDNSGESNDGIHFNLGLFQVFLTL